MFPKIGVVESLYAIKNKYFKRFSEQNLIDCTYMVPNSNTGRANQGCNGGWPDTALDYVKNHGVVEESYYPYKQRVKHIFCFVLFMFKCLICLVFIVNRKDSARREDCRIYRAFK